MVVISSGIERASQAVWLLPCYCKLLASNRLDRRLFTSSSTRLAESEQRTARRHLYLLSSARLWLLSALFFFVVLLASLRLPAQSGVGGITTGSVEERASGDCILSALRFILLSSRFILLSSRINPRRLLLFERDGYFRPKSQEHISC